MYSIIIPKIKAVLDTLVGTGKPLTAVYDYPEENIVGSPVAIFYPTTIENDFITNKEDFTLYKFTIEIIARTARDDQKTKQALFNTVLSGAVDSVMTAITNAWDTGQIAGSQSWLKLDSGSWELIQNENGINAVSSLDITIKTKRLIS